MSLGRSTCLIVVLMLLASCSSGPPTGPDAAKALIDSSAAAMGGWDAMHAIKGQEILTGGGDWEPMQSPEPSADPIRINTFGQSMLADFEHNRMRITFDAMRVYPNPGPIKFAEVIDGDIGMLQTVGADGKVTAERLHPSRLASRLRDYNRLPIRLLTVAKSAPELTRVQDISADKKVYRVIRYKDAGEAVEVQFDSFNNLPARVMYLEDDPIYGDTQNEVTFTDWREWSGVRLPQVISTFLNGKKIREERVRTLINSPKLEESAFAIPDDIRSQPENGDRIVSQWTLRRAVMGVGYQDFGREQKVELAELAPGVYHVTGSTHHSMAVEMKDHIVIVEMPLFGERSEAVIKALEAKIPGKPVKYGVITHYHIDHSGGIRTYAAKGVTLIAHDSLVPFVKETLSRPKTVRPDALAKATNLQASIEGVTDSKTLTDGERSIELRAIPNEHAKGMLVAYLPKEKLIFVSDLFSPGAPILPTDTNSMANATAFYDAIKKANLTVDRIVGGHGAVGRFSDFEKAAKGPKASS